MTLTEIIDIAERIPYAKPRSPYGPDTLVFEIEGKQFCLFDLSMEWEFYNIKVDPELSEELRERHTCIRPGFHMNKRHWVSVDYESLSRPIHEALLRHASLQTVGGMSRKIKTRLFGSVEEFETLLAESIEELRNV